MVCARCGREVVNGYCVNVHCPGMNWRGTKNSQADVIELRPAIEQDFSSLRRAYVGSILVKEVRFIDGNPCQGISLSKVAVGTEKKKVEGSTCGSARQWAEQYEQRGYRVMLRRIA